MIVRLRVRASRSNSDTRRLAGATVGIRLLRRTGSMTNLLSKLTGNPEEDADRALLDKLGMHTKHTVHDAKYSVTE